LGVATIIANRKSRRLITYRQSSARTRAIAMSSRSSLFTVHPLCRNNFVAVVKLYNNSSEQDNRTPKTPGSSHGKIG
jgi:hypothetical protein